MRQTFKHPLLLSVLKNGEKYMGADEKRISDKKRISYLQLTLLFAALLMLFILMPSSSYARLDAPHNQVNGISCANCHVGYGQDTSGIYDPSQNGFDVLCKSCHKATGPGTEMETHSSVTTSTKYGNWSTQCVYCHFPHDQRQLTDWYDTDKVALFVETGTITALSSNTITDSTKSWTPNQFVGYTLLPNTTTKGTTLSWGYKITANTANTITVDIGSWYPLNNTDPQITAPGNGYAIIYGKFIKSNKTSSQIGYLIREEIEGIVEIVYGVVKFFRPDGANSFADGDNIYTGICEVCHERTDHHRYDGTAPVMPHYNAQRCTSCHLHRAGFKPGESEGGVDCSGCHSDLFNPMNSSTSSYHHYIANADPSYPVISDPSTLTPDEPRKRCLQCHVDHDIFRPDINTLYGARAKNLRTSIGISPSPTDTSTFTNTDFDGSISSGGICVSCHNLSLTKNTTKQKDDGTTKTYAVTKDDFSGSIHNYLVSSVFATDSSTFQGNCVKCHNDSLSKQKQSSTVKFGLHDSNIRRLLTTNQSSSGGTGSPTATVTESTYNSLDENFCFLCHENSVNAATDIYLIRSMSAASKAIKSEFSKAYRHPVDSVSYAGKHTPVESSNSSFYGTGRHIECMDCHNPHVASSGMHSLKTNALSSALKGASGVDPVWSTAIWTPPTGFSFIQSLSPLSNYEYQLCLKCHSSWGALPSGYTDQSLEFSPYNRAGHPVVIGLNNYTNSATPRTLSTSQMTASWNSVGNQRMYCSDCHGSESTSSPQGPHGSNAPYILKGPRVYWPAGSSGTLFSLNDIRNNTNNWSTELFCLNCHPIYSGGTWMNNVHDEHWSRTYKPDGTTNRNIYCIACHSVIPHGTKRSRLIVYDGRDTKYGAADPEPYRYVSGGVNFAALSGFKKAAGPNSYTKDNCYSKTSGCTTHTDKGGYDN